MLLDSAIMLLGLEAAAVSVLLVGAALGALLSAVASGCDVCRRGHGPAKSDPAPPPLGALWAATPGRAVPSPAGRAAEPGCVYLVGAGLGDADLLTVRALRLIQTADVVLFDRLISAEIRSLAAPGAEVHIARKVPGKADAAQAELNALGARAAQAGRSVVRVKIGDPLLFARGGEEICVYRGLGIEPVLVPGLSSALVAPLLAKIPVTHRGVANQLLIATGRDRGGRLPDLPAYSPSRTLVLLMAVGRLGTLFEGALAPLGFPPSTPLAVIEDASLPTERQTVTTVAEVAAMHAARPFKAPAVVVIGRVVGALADAAVAAEARMLGPAPESLLRV